MKLKLSLLLFAFVFCTRLYAQQAVPFGKEVHAFQRQDSLNFPQPNEILFIGASSIHYWTDLEQRFSNVPIIRRGLGGSELWQWVTYYMPTMVYPYHPRKIFIYAGENDIATSHKSAQFVADQFALFCDMVHQNLPDAEIYYLSIKESPLRIKLTADFIQANKLIKAYTATKPKTYYINMSDAVLNDKMQPDSSLYKPDYLHLNSKGYDKWQAVLQDYVK